MHNLSRISTLPGLFAAVGEEQVKKKDAQKDELSLPWSKKKDQDKGKGKDKGKVRNF